jgi:hypothetical protein
MVFPNIFKKCRLKFSGVFEPPQIQPFGKILIIQIWKKKK